MIEKKYIVTDLDLKSKDDVVDFIGKKALELGITDDANALIADIKDRENQFSTDIGFGISIPHTKSVAVKKIAVLFFRYKNNIKWNENSKKSDLVKGNGNEGVIGSIVFLTPKNNEDNIHLTMLSKISRQLMHKEFLNMLFNEKNSEKIYENLKKVIES